MNLEFIEMKGLTEHDYAAVLRESEIYLTTSEFEGINISVLEAMACGCICIGFDGIGGKDYIIGEGEYQNFIQVEPMNFIELSRQLYDLLTKIDSKDSFVDKIRENDLRTARKFGNDCEAESVLSFWRNYCDKIGKSDLR